MMRASGEDLRTTTLCIDSYEKSVSKGRFYNRHLPEGRVFESITQFLLEMERILNEAAFPQAFTSVRAFAPPSPLDTGPPETKVHKGEAATFTVRILFRQNSSWQGSLIWLEGKQEQSFRSILEFLQLIDSAMSVEKVS